MDSFKARQLWHSPDLVVKVYWRLMLGLHPYPKGRALQYLSNQWQYSRRSVDRSINHKEQNHYSFDQKRWTRYWSWLQLRSLFAWQFARRTTQNILTKTILAAISDHLSLTAKSHIKFCPAIAQQILNVWSVFNPRPTMTSSCSTAEAQR